MTAVLPVQGQLATERFYGFGPLPSPDDTARAYDACVIGSGASGALTAALLADAGLDVVVVEVGPFVGPDVSYDDILAGSESAWARQENGGWARIGYPWSTSNVGGGSVFYGGASFRLRAEDLTPSSRLGRSDVEMDAPKEWVDLDLHYDQVEAMLGVAGTDHGDPSLPGGGPSYALPATEPTQEAIVLTEAGRRLGWHPFATPLAITTSGKGASAVCDRSSSCISSRCPTGAKADLDQRLLRPRILDGRLRLFAGLKVDRLRRSGGVVRFADCVRVDTGKRFSFTADVFFVAANAIQSAALLLRSADQISPNGLGNGNDLVGRGLCMKQSEYLIGYRRLSATEALPEGRTLGLGPFSTVSFTDHYIDDRAPGGFGGLIYEARPEKAVVPGGRDQVLRIECLTADTPTLSNRARLSTHCDDHGIEDVVIDYLPNPVDSARLQYLLERGEGLLREAGCSLITREPSGWSLGSGHLHGTCRAGVDPRTSVTDPEGRVHGEANVILVDGSVLPFPGAVNPTLTIQALAHRTVTGFLRRNDLTGLRPERDLYQHPV